MTEQTKRTFLVGFLSSHEDTWGRILRVEKKFKQTLQLTVRCKVGGIQASLFLEALLVFLFSLTVGDVSY